MNNPILWDFESYFIVSIIFHQPDFDGEMLGHEEEKILVDLSEICNQGIGQSSEGTGIVPPPKHSGEMLMFASKCCCFLVEVYPIGNTHELRFFLLGATDLTRIACHRNQSL